MIFLVVTGISMFAFVRRLNETDFQKLERRAFAGDVAAQKELADAYLLGKGVPVNRVCSYAWHCIIQVKDPKHYAIGGLIRATELYPAAVQQEGERLAAELWGKIKR